MKVDLSERELELILIAILGEFGILEKCLKKKDSIFKKSFEEDQKDFHKLYNRLTFLKGEQE